MLVTDSPLWGVSFHVFFFMVHMTVSNQTQSTPVTYQGGAIRWGSNNRRGI